MIESMKLKILLANDDGIDSRGIHELARSLRDGLGAEIYVFAPDGQRSGASHSISLREAVKVWRAPFEEAAMAYAISGTPADCVSVGLKVLREQGIMVDMVFAGVNHGSNTGTDTLYSGTIGAAREGSIQGYPSVAVSVDSHQAEFFEYACDLAVDTVIKTGGKWDNKLLININTPNLPKNEIKGVRYTIVGDKEYTNDIQVENVDGEVTSYVYAGEAVYYEDGIEENDVIALQRGYASISMLHRDLTAHEAKLLLDDWRIGR